MSESQPSEMPRKSYGATAFVQQLFEEAQIMAEYAAQKGLKVPNDTAYLLLESAKVLERLETDQETKQGFAELEPSLKSLTRLHAKLSKLVAPATPVSISQTINVQGFASTLPNISVVRNMLILGVLSLAAYVGLLCLGVQTEPVILQMKMLAAAGLGASFHALFTANRYVMNNTFDAKYSSSYYIRYILGLIAGPILANMLLQINANSVQNGDAAGQTAQAIQQLGPTAVSLLGGYSADAVNRILNRFVEMLNTLVKGDTKEIMTARESEIKARAEHNEIRQTQALVTKLLAMRREVQDDALGEKLDGLVDELSSGELTER